jgi:hypothetical protein
MVAACNGGLKQKAPKQSSTSLWIRYSHTREG